MKAFLITLAGLFVVLWFLNYPVLSRQFDMDSCMAQIKFWHAREIVYEFMMIIFGLVAFFSTKGILKSVLCFSVIMVTGDLVDKLAFGIKGYVFGDIVLILFGLIVSIYVYRRSLG